MILIHTNRKAI